jgi:hypothetical protein
MQSIPPKYSSTTLFVHNALHMVITSCELRLSPVGKILDYSSVGKSFVVTIFALTLPVDDT